MFLGVFEPLKPSKGCWATQTAVATPADLGEGDAG
jgi:hypothetical protein